MTTREYDPVEMAGFGPAEAETQPAVRALASRSYAGCSAWIVAGLGVMAIRQEFSLLREVLLLGAAGAQDTVGLDDGRHGHARVRIVPGLALENLTVKVSPSARLTVLP